MRPAGSAEAAEDGVRTGGVSSAQVRLAETLSGPARIPALRGDSSERESEEGSLPSAASAPAADRGCRPLSVSTPAQDAPGPLSLLRHVHGQARTAGPDASVPAQGEVRLSEGGALLPTGELDLQEEEALRP